MLYLHVGTGKAGSTTIQRFLANQRAALPYRQLDAFSIGNAWKIAAAMSDEGNRAYWVERKQVLTAAEHKELRSVFWTNVRREVAGLEASDFVASSEHLYGQLGCDRDAVARLREHLVENFEKVKVLIYFRNQIDFVKSKYAQSVKGFKRSTMSFPKYIENLESLEVPIHYAGRLQVWVDVFGAENVEAVVFDKGNFPNGSLIEDFCMRMGIEYDKDRFSVHEKRENTSPSFSQLNVLRFLNYLPIARTDSRRLLQFLQPILPSRGFPETYDDLILAMVSEENKWLNRTYFSDMAVKLPENA